MRRYRWHKMKVTIMKMLIVLFALLVPFSGIAKDKGEDPAYVPVTAYATLAQTYGATTGTIYNTFDFTAPYVLYSIELRLDSWGSATTECESEIQLHDTVNLSYTVLAKKSWRAVDDISILRLEFPTPVLIDPETHVLGLMIQPNGGFCSVTFNGIASGP